MGRSSRESLRFEIRFAYRLNLHLLDPRCKRSRKRCRLFDEPQFRA